MIGKIKEVQELDRKRHQLKLLQKEKNQNKDYAYLEEKYKEEFAHVQVMVLAKSTNIQADLKTWERGYLLKNDFNAPTSAQINSDKEASILYKKLKYAKTLLKEWNINFYK